MVETFFFSLVTLSVLSNTSIGNQGNHCIVAASSFMPPPAYLGNLVLVGDADGCQKRFQDLMLKAFNPILQSMSFDALTGGK